MRIVRAIDKGLSVVYLPDKNCVQIPRTNHDAIAVDIALWSQLTRDSSERSTGHLKMQHSLGLSFTLPEADHNLFCALHIMTTCALIYL